MLHTAGRVDLRACPAGSFRKNCYQRIVSQRTTIKNFIKAA